MPGRELLRPRARDDDRAGRDVAAMLDRLGAGHVDDRHATRSASRSARSPPRGRCARPRRRCSASRGTRRPRRSPAARRAARARRRSRRRRRDARSAPICAPEPTVAHVSTIVFGPTQAPMFTYDGISTTPRREVRAVARGRRRDDAHAERLVARLERDLVVVLERPDLARLHLPQAEVVEDRRLHVAVDAPVVAVRLGDAHLAAVERGDRPLRCRSQRAPR